jgi:hypothetical protein
MLGVGSVTAQNEKGEPIATVAFEALQLGLLLRDKWTSFKAELDSLELTDFFTKNTRFSQIIAPQRRNQKLFDFRLELNPVGQNFDTGVYLVTKPMNIVYNYPLINRVISFIVDPLSSAPSRKKKSGINLKSESQLDFLLKLKKTLYLDLDIHVSLLIRLLCKFLSACLGTEHFDARKCCRRSGTDVSGYFGSIQDEH